MKKLFTIGSSGKSAETFFNLLNKNDIITLLDIRLNNTSQLAGFTKKNDLKFFLDKICNIEYIHLPILAPTESILKDYKNKVITWDEYEEQYIKLIKNRNIDGDIYNINLNNACLLCSEKMPDNCHRRLAAEFLKNEGKIEIIKHII